MSTVRDRISALFQQADRRLPAGFYTMVSISTKAIQEELRQRGKAFIDPSKSEEPPMIDVDASARWAIEQAAQSAATLGGVASLGGVLTVPPETVASAVATLRLAQRLAVIYGFDPEKDSGEMAVWKALAEGMEVDLPQQGPMSVRVRDMAPMVVPDTQLGSVSAKLTRRVLRQSAWRIARRVTRFVPVISAGLSIVNSRQRMSETGERMRLSIRKLRADFSSDGLIEDAIELG